MLFLCAYPDVHVVIRIYVCVWTRLEQESGLKEKVNDVLQGTAGGNLTCLFAWRTAHMNYY